MIDISKVASVYSGRDGKCCCGCSGMHYHTALGISQMSETDYRRNNLPNPTQVTRIVNTVNNAAEGAVEFNGTMYSYVDGRRLYIVYMASFENSKCYETGYSPLSR